MANEQHSSFIPKDSNVQTRSWEKPASNFLILLSLVVLIFTLLLWGGVFAYHNYLMTQINQECPGIDTDSTACGLLAEVDRVKEELPQEQINQVREIDVKLRTVNTLLSQRRSVWPALALLNSRAIASVQLTNFELQNNQINLTGLSRGYRDVAIQAMVWQSDNDIEQVNFTEVSRRAGENLVDFKVELELNSQLLSSSN